MRCVQHLAPSGDAGAPILAGADVEHAAPGLGHVEQMHQPARDVARVDPGVRRNRRRQHGVPAAQRHSRELPVRTKHVAHAGVAFPRAEHRADPRRDHIESPRLTHAQGRALDRVFCHAVEAGRDAGRRGFVEQRVVIEAFAVAGAGGGGDDAPHPGVAGRAELGDEADEIHLDDPLGHLAFARRPGGDGREREQAIHPVAAHRGDKRAGIGDVADLGGQPPWQRREGSDRRFRHLVQREHDDVFAAREQRLGQRQPHESGPAGHHDRHKRSRPSARG